MKSKFHLDLNTLEIRTLSMQRCLSASWKVCNIYLQLPYNFCFWPRSSRCHYCGSQTKQSFEKQTQQL